MKIFNAIADANTVPLYYDKTGHKMNALISYMYLKGNGYKLAKKYRDMINLLYLDSGAFSVYMGKAKITVSEYRRFLRRYGNLFDEVFTLDDDFRSPDHNFNNQAFLEEGLPDGAKRPIPVIHDEDDPFSEFEVYAELGHDFIAIGSNKKISDNVFRKIKDTYPDIKIHMFGNLNRKMLIDHKPYSADSAAWAHQAAKGCIYYFDPNENKDHLIYLGDREKDDDKLTLFSEFELKDELESFLANQFDYEHNDLLTNYNARWVVNLYFFKQLEDYINSI